MSVTYIVPNDALFGHLSRRICIRFVFKLLCINRLP